MAKARYGRLWTTVLVFTILLTGFAFPSKAWASSTDWAASANGGSINSSDFTNSALTIDSDDSTAGTFTTWGSNCNSYGDAFAPYNRVAVGGGSALTIAQVHVKLVVPCFGTNSSIEIACGSGGYYWVKGFPITNTVTDADLDLTTGGSGYSGKCTTTATSVISVRYWMGGSGGVASLFSFRAYDSPQSNPLDYLMNFEVHNSFASKWFTWQWKKNWTGSWVFCRIASGACTGDVFQNGRVAQRGHTLAFTESDTAYPLSRSAPMDLCGVGGCNAGGWRLTMTDISNGAVVSYDVLANANGVLIAQIRAPRWSSVIMTLTNTGGVYTALVSYEFVITDCLPGGSIPCGTQTADVKIGPQLIGPTALGAAPIDGTPPCTGTAKSEWLLYGCTNVPVDITKSNIWVAYASNAVGSAVFVLPPMDFGVGPGASTTVRVVDPTAGSNPNGGNSSSISCGLTDLACNLNKLAITLGQGIAAIFEVGVEIALSAYQKLYDIVVAKQPFATILGTGAAVITQIARAQTGVTSTSTCPGYVMTMPSLPQVTYTDFSGSHTLDAWPTSVPMPSFAVMKCADIEPIGGTMWWQNMRTVMDSAVYLGYGFMLLKRWQARPTMGG